ncbi:hypothetical protein TWF694_001733 [Orbilia ellipsospora]|uniref:Uncharacterized protein n=1 Tax=Orbilia ellipsospora TaxID=2528407 RepID=A0AAV9X3Q9_9PEZI
MFDINQTEIVSREDLVPPSAEDDLPPSLSAGAIDWSAILGYTISDHDVSISDRSSSPDLSKEPEVSFRLFAPTKGSDNVHTYVLPNTPPPEAHTLLSEDQSASLIPPHFSESDIQKAHATHRPLNYYLAITPPPEDDHKAAQIRNAAVSGEDILRQSRQRWWGCEVPWKVRKLTLVGKSQIEEEKKAEVSSTVNVIHEALPLDTEKRKRRTRPSKKLRIILRTQRAAEEARLAKVATRPSKKQKKAKKADIQAVNTIHKRTDEEDKEKRTRMNRLKKIRRRLKEQEKKGAAASAVA